MSRTTPEQDDAARYARRLNDLLDERDDAHEALTRRQQLKVRVSGLLSLAITGLLLSGAVGLVGGWLQIDASVFVAPVMAVSIVGGIVCVGILIFLTFDDSADNERRNHRQAERALRRHQESA